MHQFCNILRREGWWNFEIENKNAQNNDQQLTMTSTS
jgi:hypothetical protein